MATDAFYWETTIAILLLSKMTHWIKKNAEAGLIVYPFMSSIHCGSPVLYMVLKLSISYNANFCHTTMLQAWNLLRWSSIHLGHLSNIPPWAILLLSKLMGWVGEVILPILSGAQVRVGRFCLPIDVRCWGKLLMQLIGCSSWLVPHYIAWGNMAPFTHFRK